MIAKHTPGPWAAYGRIIRDVEDGEDQIAEVMGTGNAENTKANADLIASAPDLLEALRYARRFVKPADVDTDFIDAAIAKATGQ